MKILVGIVCIDRDADLAQDVYDALMVNKVQDILIVTRENDSKTRNFWEDKAVVITVPRYDLNKRHNFYQIAKKRNIVVQHAKDNNYDAIWFVDSDIIPLPETLQKLCKTDKDICLAPYKVPWLDDKVYIGLTHYIPPYFKLHEVSAIDIIHERKPCVIGGFGCTLINKSTFHVPLEYILIKNDDILVEGEDIGFFINCYKAGKTCEYLTDWIQPHMYNRKKE